MDLFFMTGPEQSAGSSRSSPGHPGRQETDHNLHFEYQVRFPSDGLPSLLTGLGSLVSLFALLDNDSLAQHNGAMAANAEQIDESLKRQALAEEEAAMNQYKKSTNPFLSSPTAATATPVSGAGSLRFTHLMERAPIHWASSNENEFGPASLAFHRMLQSSRVLPGISF